MECEDDANGVLPRNTVTMDDWPSGVPAAIQQLEECLTCPMCSGALSPPLTLPCGHTFCSYCIRKWQETSTSSVCPTCRASCAGAGAIVPCKILDELMYHYNTVKPFLIGAAKCFIQQQSQQQQQSGGKADASSVGDDVVSGRKRKRSESVGAKCPEGASLPSPPLGSAHNSNSNSNTAIPSDPAMIQPVGNPANKKYYKDRRPVRAYAHFPDKLVKSDLAEWGFSTSGSKSVLQTRHREYTQLWNVQLQAFAPVHPDQLRDMVMNKERAENKARRIGDMASAFAERGAAVTSAAPHHAVSGHYSESTVEHGRAVTQSGDSSTVAAGTVGAVAGLYSAGPVSLRAPTAQALSSSFVDLTSDDETERRDIPPHPRNRPPRHKVSFEWKAEGMGTPQMLEGWRRLAEETRARMMKTRIRTSPAGLPAHKQETLPAPLVDRTTTAAAAIVSDTQESDSQLSLGSEGPWRVVYSTALHRPFYFNQETGVGQFSKPAGLPLGSCVAADRSPPPTHAGVGTTHQDSEAITTALKPADALPLLLAEVYPSASTAFVNPTSEGGTPDSKRQRSEDAGEPVHDEVVPPPGAWACLACTFVNTKGARKCRVCSTKRYEPGLSAADEEPMRTRRGTRVVTAS